LTPEVRKELNDLLLILHNWKESWLQHYTPEGPNEWIFEEICGLIFGDDVYCYGYFNNYVKRLHECDYLTAKEYNTFWEEVWDELNDMRERLHLPGPDGSKVTTLPQ